MDLLTLRSLSLIQSPIIQSIVQLFPALDSSDRLISRSLTAFKHDIFAAENEDNRYLYSSFYSEGRNFVPALIAQLLTPNLFLRFRNEISDILPHFESLPISTALQKLESSSIKGKLDLLLSIRDSPTTFMDRSNGIEFNNSILQGQLQTRLPLETLRNYSPKSPSRRTPFANRQPHERIKQNRNKKYTLRFYSIFAKVLRGVSKNDKL
jgi:hypothetical protein